MSPRVSVVIVNLNRRDLLDRCLQSVWGQTFTNFEVVAVDNGSVDGSLAYLQGVVEPRLKIVALPVNQGFAGGCNAGIRAASGEWIATLNNDAEADPRWLEELLHAADANPAIGMCAAKILLAGQDRRIDKVGHLIYMDGLNHGRGSGQPDHGQFDLPEEVLIPDGAAALYRRSMLDTIGLFDERFFAYGDDCDLGLRGRLAGWTCRYVPTAVVHHLHSATSGKFSTLKAFLIERNRIFVALKLLPLPLLLVSPAWTIARMSFHAFGALLGVGSSGEYARDCSRLGLISAILRAYWSALKMFPGMWASRREIRRFARLSSAEFATLLWRHRISLRALTLGT